METSDEEIQELVDDFSEAVHDLKTPDGDYIKTLTTIMEENKDVASEQLAHVVQKRIREAPLDQVLPALYLLDSVCKSVRDPYVRIFSQHLTSLFTQSFQRLQRSSIRISLLKLLKTWPQTFPPDEIWKIEQRMRGRHRIHKDFLPQIHSKYANKIFINPDLFQRANVPNIGPTQPTQKEKPKSRKHKRQKNAPRPRSPPPQDGSFMKNGNGPPQQPVPSGKYGPVQYGPPQQPPPGHQFGPPQQPPPQYGMQAQGFYGSPQQPPPGGQFPQQPPPGFAPQNAPPNMYGMPQQPESELSSILDVLDGENHSETIHQLYDAFKLKCNICGLRFHMQSTLDKHLDQHIERNQETKKTLARKWYQDEDEWDEQITEEPMESPGASAFSKLTESSGKKRRHSDMSSPTDNQNELFTDTVKADANQEFCPICREPFSKYYDENEDEWMFRGAKRDTDPSSKTYQSIVHAACLKFQHGSPTTEPPSKKKRANEAFS